MIIELPSDIPRAERLGHVHFVGIGGAALSGLARIMHARGIAVSGSDSKDSAALRGLRELGIRCDVGHAAEHVVGADTVVVSTAIGADNPEVVCAHELGLRVWPRAAAVQSVLLGKTALVVTGTHGKTTTTSMLATALLTCGADPSYAIGSTLSSSGLNAAAGRGQLFVAEGDESDAAILAYTPTGVAVTNVDVDHLDFFGTPDAYAEVFRSFVARIQPGGFLVCCVDDDGAAELADFATGSRDDVAVIRVGLVANPSVDLLADEVSVAGLGSSYVARKRGEVLGAVTLQLPGEAYVADSLCALAVGLELGFGFDDLARGLASFEGSARRMEFKGEARGIRVYDSYAHHPTEIAGDVAAARQLAGDGRLIVAFQPHLFSRTRAFGKQMGAKLSAADVVVVLDVYPAREQPVAGVDGSLVSLAVDPETTDVTYEPDWDAVAPRLAALARPGDLVVTLGAGDVTEIGPLVLGLLRSTDEEGGQPT